VRGGQKSTTQKEPEEQNTKYTKKAEPHEQEFKGATRKKAEIIESGM